MIRYLVVFGLFLAIGALAAEPSPVLGGVTNGNNAVWVVGVQGGVTFHTKGPAFRGEYLLTDAGIQLIRMGLRELEARRPAMGPDMPLRYRIGSGDFQVEFPVADRVQAVKLFAVLDKADSWIASGGRVNRRPSEIQPARPKPPVKWVPVGSANLL